MLRKVDFYHYSPEDKKISYLDNLERALPDRFKMDWMRAVRTCLLGFNELKKLQVFEISVKRPVYISETQYWGPKYALRFFDWVSKGEEKPKWMKDFVLFTDSELWKSQPSRYEIAQVYDDRLDGLSLDLRYLHCWDDKLRLANIINAQVIASYDNPRAKEHAAVKSAVQDSWTSSI